MNSTITDLLNRFDCEKLEMQAQFDIENVIEKSLKQQYTKENIAQCIACIDYTTLTPRDTESSVKGFVKSLYTKTAGLNVMPAAICVYPNFAKVVSEGLSGSGVKTAVVAAAFPASQTFMEIKRRECELAIVAGADEVDIVIPVGAMIEGDYSEVYNELV